MHKVICLDAVDVISICDSVPFYSEMVVGDLSMGVRLEMEVRI